jgi:DNA damage-binding protein 1
MSTSSASARDRYEEADSQGSKQAHDAAALSRSLLEPAHQDTHCGGILRPLVFGGLDGINTTFAVVAGATGADFPIAQVLSLGFVSLFAGAFSMGMGECTSAKAELALQRWERARETWEFENYPEGEIQEMVDIYKRKGMTETDAHLIMSTMSKYHDVFIDHMMVEELGIMPDAPNKDPKVDGLAMFAAFTLSGTVPLLSFIVKAAVWGKQDQQRKGTAFGVCCGLSALALTIIGAGQARYRKQSPQSTCLQMLFNGFVSGAVAYGTGRSMNQILS